VHISLYNHHFNSHPSKLSWSFNFCHILNY